MSSLRIGRLLVGPPLQWQEMTGDPLTNVGGAVIADTRTPLSYQVQVGTYAADGEPDTPADRLRIRRQLRSLLNNTPLKMQAFLYVDYSDDPEQNGWYAIGQQQWADITGTVGLATGFWTMQGSWMVIGRPNLNREAREIWMKDLRTGLPWRDTLKQVYSTDFAALSGQAVTILPAGAYEMQDAVSGLIPRPGAIGRRLGWDAEPDRPRPR